MRTHPRHLIARWSTAFRQWPALLFLHRPTPVQLLVAFSLAIAGVVSCSDDTSTEPAFVSVTIQSPADGATVPDTLLHVRTEVRRNCGCSAYVEFTLDSTFIVSSFTPPYAAEIPLAGLRGEHMLIAHAVVTGRAESRDTIRITVTP